MAVKKSRNRSGIVPFFKFISTKKTVHLQLFFGKGLDLPAEPPHIKLCCVPPPPPRVTHEVMQHVTNTRHRIALTKLRLSNHKLAIEKGRYSRPFKKTLKTEFARSVKQKWRTNTIFYIYALLTRKKMLFTRLCLKRIQKKKLAECHLTKYRYSCF